MKRKDTFKQIVNERERLKFHMIRMMLATDNSCAARYAKKKKKNERVRRTYFCFEREID